MSRFMLIAALVVLASLCSLVCAAPGDLVALHQLVVVPATGDVLIRMQGYNQGKASNKVSAAVRSGRVVLVVLQCKWIW